MTAYAYLPASGGVLPARLGNRCGVPRPLTPNPSPRWCEGSRTAEERKNGARRGLASFATETRLDRLGTEYRGQNRRLKAISVARPFGRNLCYPWVVHWQNALLEVFNPSRCAHRNQAARSNPHKFVQLRGCHAPVEETKLACVFHLACSVEQTRHGRAIE